MSTKLIAIYLLIFVLAGAVLPSLAKAPPSPQNGPPLYCYPSGFVLGHNFMLATTHDGNLFKATDQGWKKLSPPTTGSLGIDSEGTIYMLRHYQTDVPAPVYRSTDGGATWSRRGEGWFDSIFPSPKPDWVFATSAYNDPTEGIYKSTDGGLTWKPVFLWRARSLSFSPDFADDGVAFGVAGGSVVKTTTGGDTWFRAYPLYPLSERAEAVGQGSGTNSAQPQAPWEFDWVVVSPQFPQDHTVFAGGGVLGIYKTTDGGDSWFKVASYASGYGSGVLTPSPHYLYDQTLLLGEESGLYLSHDGGLTWQQIDEGPLYELYNLGIREQGPLGIPAVAPSPPPGPDLLYFPFMGRQSGALEFWVVHAWEQFGNCYLYRSRDEGATWEEVSVFEASHWHYLPWVSRSNAR